MTVLDPSAIGAANDAPRIDRTIPSIRPETRALGFVPDSRLLQTGDLLLTEPLKRNWVAKVIQKCQGSVYLEDANWTHAAIYIDDWMIIHCTPWKGVHIATLLDYAFAHKIKARRISKIAQSSAVPLQAKNMGLELVLRACMAIKASRYDYLSAIRVYIDAISMSAAYKLGKYRASERVYMCSTLFANAALEALGVNLHPTRLSETNIATTPQMLSRSDMLEDVDLRWARLPD